MNLTDEELHAISDDLRHADARYSVVNLCRAAIRAHMEKLVAECGVEPDTHYFDDDTGKDVWSYSAYQLVTAVARKAAEYDGLMEDHQALSFENIANIRRIDQLLARVVELEAQLDGMKGGAV